MPAALELANSGYYVHLVGKKPASGDQVHAMAT